MVDEPNARRDGRAITLHDGSAVPVLVQQFERRLEVIHVQAHSAIQVSHGLTGNLAGVAIIIGEPAGHGAILMLNASLIVLAIRPGAWELNALIGTVHDQRRVDERTVVTHSALVRVGAWIWKGSLLPMATSPATTSDCSRDSKGTAWVQPV